MKIKAKFIGTESLGYRFEETYELWFNVLNGKVWISRKEFEGTCPYDSLKSFLNNWEVI